MTNNITSPIIPIEKDIYHILPNEKPVVATSSLEVFIQMVEPVLFLRGFDFRNKNDNDSANEYNDDDSPPPCILRGSVIIKISKPTKFKKISLTFKGTSKIDWPEGIATLLDAEKAKYTLQDEYFEKKNIIENSWPFFNFKNIDILQYNDIDNNNNTISAYSGASIYRPLKSVTPPHHQNNNDNDDLSDISPSTSIKTTSSDHASFVSDSDNLHKNNTSQRRGSFFSDFLSVPFYHTTNSTSTSPNTKEQYIEKNIDDPKLFNRDNFIFPPGEYVYPFEQLISHRLPETVKVDYAQVKYELLLEIKRFSMFKSNFLLSKPIQVIRSPSDTSIEESEPIAISKSWKERLNYDILINSKDVILDAFLPISIHLTPTDKIYVYRTRIYITESLEYYGQKKAIHRMEKMKKYLLVEHNGPLKDPNGNLDMKNFRNYGNLLQDESGDLGDKIFEYQVFVPRVFNGYRQLHPDMTNEDIVVNHWLKISFRVSFMVDDVMKFFEISIDSPIKILHKFCSHANTLLPNYYSNIVTPNDEISRTSTANNLYHNSNIFFPKELCSSPILSSDVNVFDLTIPSILQKEDKNNKTHSNNGTAKKRLSFSLASLSSSKPLYENKVHEDDNPNLRRHSITLVNSPKMISNIYQPLTLAKELAYPQAIPAFKSTVTVSMLKAAEPPPPYEKRRHSVPNSYSTLANLSESQETLIGNNIDLNIGPNISFKNSYPFKKPPNTTLKSTIVIPPTSVSEIKPVGGVLLKSQNSKIPNYRRNSIAPEPKYNDMIRPRNINQILSGYDPKEDEFAIDDEDAENDLTMFNLDMNSWYPNPL